MKCLPQLLVEQEKQYGGNRMQIFKVNLIIPIYENMKLLGIYRKWSVKLNW